MNHPGSLAIQQSNPSFARLQHFPCDSPRGCLMSRYRANQGPGGIQQRSKRTKEIIFDSEDKDATDRLNLPHQKKKYFWQEKFSELLMDVEDYLSLSCTFENGPCIFFEGLTHARHVPSNCQHPPSSFLPHQHPTLQHPTPRNGLRCGLPSNHGVWQTGMCLVINGQRTRERRIVGTNHLSTFDGIISTESVYLIRRSETMDYILLEADNGLWRIRKPL